MSEKKYYMILGLDYPVFVGIDYTNGDKAGTFYADNLDVFREPNTPAEKKSCVAAAMDRYNFTDTEGHIGDFGLLPLPAEIILKIADGKISDKLMLSVLTNAFNNLRVCRYCGNSFVAQNYNQSVCEAPECERKRVNEAARNYKRRKSKL